MNWGWSGTDCRTALPLQERNTCKKHKTQSKCYAEVMLGEDINPRESLTVTASSVGPASKEQLLLFYFLLVISK